MGRPLEEGIARAAAILKKGRVVALTGAGISVESGIPDFRSKGGLWSRYDPMEYGTIHAFMADPGKVWRMMLEMRELLINARPNPAHETLARMEEMGLLTCVVTQNIDGLHQLAGSKNVVEYHGHARTLTCIGCGGSHRDEEISLEELPPRCSCGGALKPDVVFFGEQIPPAAMTKAGEAVLDALSLLVVGTSAEVVPASMLPDIARSRGAKVVEVNIESTALTPHADVSLRGNAGEIMPRLFNELVSLSVH